MSLVLLITYICFLKREKYIWVCDLSSRSREFRDLTWYQVWERQAAQKQILAQAKYQFTPVERDFDDLLEKKLKKARKNRKTSSIEQCTKDK